MQGIKLPEEQMPFHFPKVIKVVALYIGNPTPKDSRFYKISPVLTTTSYIAQSG